MRICCQGEAHSTGGPGAFMLSPAETALPGLIERYGGKVQLIYLDPPFGTGDVFYMRGHSKKTALRLPAFSDRMDESEYLAFMRSILAGCHALLSETGSLYLHIDYRMSARLKLLLDDIFGADNFLNEIIWCYKSGGRSTTHFPRKHDNILFYRKGPKVYFNIAAVGVPRGRERRNHMKKSLAEDGRVCFTIRSGGKTYTYYEDTPVYPTDVWNDIEHLQQKDGERVGYATQKPEALLSRIISASSRPGDIVMDLFSGSGTTAAVCGKLQRQFVAVDSSPIALYTLRARQLLSGEEPSLLSGPRELTLRYPADETPAEVQYTLEQSRSRYSLTVQSADFGEGAEPVYAALGSVSGGLFRPRALNCRPTLPLKLETPKFDGPVLQIVDELGRQAFWAVE